MLNHAQNRHQLYILLGVCALIQTIMIPREKAELLIDKMYSISGHIRFSKAYALICVSEIKAALIEYGKSTHELQNMDTEMRYWEQVEMSIDAF